MDGLTADDLALALEIKHKRAVGINTRKEKAELSEKIRIADRIGDRMGGLPLDAETVMIEMTALIVAITVGIHSPLARDQSMLVTALILQRLQENDQYPANHSTERIH